MKRPAILLVLVLVIVLGFWLRRSSRRGAGEVGGETAGTEATVTNITVTVTETPATDSPAKSQPLLGETILRDYAKTNFPPANDLTLMSRLMENSQLLLKSAANRPLSANEDWADFFRGQNPARERFLADTNLALNSQGQLVDRWGTPLFFHALGGGRFEIRSAGPDQKLWTPDDLHRNADGSFRRGAELNPPSLLESSQRNPRR